METVKEKSFDALVEKFLGTGVPQHLSGAITMSNLPDDTQDYILRMLLFMKHAGYSTCNFNIVLIGWLAVTIPNMLPRAWGGRIPPITIPGRHKKFDDFVAGIDWTPEAEPLVFIDLGCGFPPVTTADTARRLPDWKIVGVDRDFADYVLYYEDKQYACYDQNSDFQYFQPLPGSAGLGFYENPTETKNRFDQLFSDLFPLLENSSGSDSKTAKMDGNRLIHNHIQDFETDNLWFIKSDALDLKLPPVKVCRIMNMLIYFKPDIREQILHQAGELLDDDGIIIAGTNGFGAQSRYTIYQKKGGDGLFPSQFAFSLDNLGHLAVMPWFTIHENDPEAMLLAKCCGAIRSDRSFWPEFSNRLDELMQHHGFCQRMPDGYLKFPEEIISMDKALEIGAMIWNTMQMEGYASNAVNVLTLAGYDAWENSVGDIAIKPPDDSLF